MLPFELDHFRKRPSMWLAKPDYWTACAYLRGMDIACHGGLLAGFQEWVIYTYDREFGDLIQNNLTWELNLEKLLKRQMTPAEHAMKQDEIDHLMIERLVQIFETYHDERERRPGGGLRRIMVRYQKWLEARDCYDPGLDNN